MLACRGTVRGMAARAVRKRGMPRSTPPRLSSSIPPAKELPRAKRQALCLAAGAGAGFCGSLVGLGGGEGAQCRDLLVMVRTRVGAAMLRNRQHAVHERDQRVVVLEVHELDARGLSGGEHTQGGEQSVMHSCLVGRS